MYVIRKSVTVIFTIDTTPPDDFHEILEGYPTMPTFSSYDNLEKIQKSPEPSAAQTKGPSKSESSNTPTNMLLISGTVASTLSIVAAVLFLKKRRKQYTPLSPC